MRNINTIVEGKTQVSKQTMHSHVILAEFWRASWEMLIQTLSMMIKQLIQWTSNQSDIVTLLAVYFIVVIRHNDLNNSVFNSLACLIIECCIFWWWWCAFSLHFDMQSS